MTTLVGRMIDFEGLIAVYNATRDSALPEFDMSLIMNSCGTSGCLLGNFVTRYKADRLSWRNNVDVWGSFSLDGDESDSEDQHAVAMRFGITPAEAAWLFYESVTNEEIRGEILEDYTTLYSRNLERTSKSQAMGRLKKFIEYKWFKHQLSLEEGRKVSGNLAVVQAAESLESEMVAV